jgi:hypothetical protein
MRKRLAHTLGLMKWEEIIAEARAAGVLAFCSEGIAVLKRGQQQNAAEKEDENAGSSVTLACEDRSEGRQSGQGESKSASEQTGA